MSRYRWETLMHGQSQMLEIAGGRLAYDVAGAGPLVVAAPSMGDLRQEYRFLVPILVAAGYRVATLDNRGQGESTARWADYSAHASGRDMLALATHLGDERFSVVGTSFTAGSGLWAAREAPARVDAIVMIGPQLKDYPLSGWQRALLTIGFAGPWRVKFWTMFWDGLFPLRKPADHQQYRAALARNLAEDGRMDALKAMLELSKSDTEAILSEPHPPALIIMGSRDKDFADPAREAQSLAALVKADLFLVDGAGHYPQVEVPEAVGRRIVEFLRSI
jgi:pimeloyl-ACP methyl ester carboxylesterase